jgi:hypothetical protein
MAKESSPAQPTMLKLALDRRSFLRTLGAGAAATVALRSLGQTALEAGTEACTLGPQTARKHKVTARGLRREAAQLAYQRPLPDHSCNDEEDDYDGTRIANFSKGLPHNGLGEVDPAAYNALLAALGSGDPADFEAIPLAGGRPRRNPQAGLAFDLEGPDSHHLAIRPAPRIDGPENSAEAAELYWLALARDVPFTDYTSSQLIAQAAADLSAFSDFRGPKQAGRVTPATIFRGNTPSDLAGPYLSQFLLKDVPFGSLTISHRQQTVVGALDYMTTFDTWLNIQNGAAAGQEDRFDSQERYIRNGRDLGQYIHVDALYEAYLNACLILLGLGAPFDSGNPYAATTKQDAFSTWGGPHILSLVTEVATRALKAVWCQKWFVHRRLRPEAFGGLVHNRLTNPAAAGYPINEEILDSGALLAVFEKYGSYLLPQAFPEGSPLHPAYGGGHAVVAGACVTILKAWFDESFVIPDPVVPNRQGTVLVAYTGPDAGSLTVGGELNKVAANIAMGRNIAGIHWRTDYSESLTLGEEVAIGILEEQQATYNEGGSFTLTKFDGTTVTI